VSLQVLSLCPPLCAARRTSIRAESTYATTVLYPFTLSSGMESRVCAYRSHSLSSARHTSNSCSFPSALRVCQFLPFFLSAQADSFSLSSAPRKPIPSLCLQRRASAYQSVLFVFGAPLIQFPLFSLSAARMPIPSLFPQRVRACQFASFVLGAQADPFPLSSASRKRMPIPYFFALRNPLTYAPAEAKVNVGLGPERTCPDRYQRQDTVLLRTTSFP